MKRILLGLAFCLHAVFSSAQAPKENALLWEISAPDQKKPSYLFGTIHLICPADFSLNDSVKTAVARTQQIALEMDMDDPGMMMAMMKTMNMTGGNELKKLVSESDYAKLDQFYRDSVGVGLAMFEKAKPFILMGPLFNSVLACQPQSYETAFVELAGQQQSEVVGLETVEEQMALFDSVPYKDQAEMVLAMINNLPAARKEFRDLVDLYKSEKINALYTMTTNSNFDLSGSEELLLQDRNRKWIPKIKSKIAEKPTFFAVGAAHLGGESGVIALLRKAGYKVRPVLK
ncbi:TraB/GumN family protein [Dyadobacter flavalbus]|uniref:TraB/GumN family protein n=1 Tax=Dyadobacter flavalbus TaxID=2579942 RepID=A0A5M8R010_9BACT|nr:TraB/GumN family protein [Dyadobacter flavalbus]KAA6440951.1 TraB/GumN family protein [Dyadobacter flavalbus]